MQIAPLSWRAWWNARARRVQRLGGDEVAAAEHAERVADAERGQRAADDLGGGQRLHRAGHYVSHRLARHARRCRSAHHHARAPTARCSSTGRAGPTRGRSRASACSTGCSTTPSTRSPRSSAAAAVTERIRLATMIAIGPLRPAATLVKDAASVQALSRGRLTLGLAVGARDDDYDARGRAAPRAAARRLSDQLGRAARLGDVARGAGPIRDRRPSCWSAALSGARVRAHGPLRRRLRARRRPAARVRERRRQGARRVERPRPPRRAPRCGARRYFALGDDASAARRTCSTTTPSPGPFAAKIAAGNLTSPRADPRLRARLRGGRLRRARAAADGLRPRPARAAGRGRSREGRRSSAPARPASTWRSCSRRPTRATRSIVVERNPPDATFGFGVVFSEETLGRLRDADEPTYARSPTRSRRGRRSTSTSAAR